LKELVGYFTLEHSIYRVYTPWITTFYFARRFVPIQLNCELYMSSSWNTSGNKYSKSCPRRNVNKAETFWIWTISIVPARRIGITLLFIFYNAESAQRGNGKQYLKNLLKITCIIRKLFQKYTYVYSIFVLTL
jgi:hypothetical protein